MRIDRFGDNLTIVFTCRYNLHDDWQTFAGWYSVKKNLPDAKVLILCDRDFTAKPAFSWTQRAGVKFFQHSSPGQGITIAVRETIVNSPFLVVPCTNMCINGFSDKTLTVLNELQLGKCNNVFFYNLKSNLLFDLFAADSSLNYENIPELSNHATEDSITTFTDFSKVDQFALDDWISKKENAPFFYCRPFATPFATANARKVLLMWDKMKTAYEVMK